MTRQEILKMRYLEMQDELRQIEDAEEAAERFAELMAAAIDEAILNSTVTIDGNTVNVQ